MIKLADSGATLFRASSALGRRTAAVRKKVHQIGKSLPGIRTIRANLRAAGALGE